MPGLRCAAMRASCLIEKALYDRTPADTPGRAIGVPVKALGYILRRDASFSHTPVNIMDA